MHAISACELYGTRGWRRRERKNAAAMSTWYQCRDCRQTGAVASPVGNENGEDVIVNGQPLDGTPLLPLCACYVRNHKGKMPAAVVGVLSGVPVLPTSVDGLEARRPAYEPPAVNAKAGSSKLRPIYAVDRLPPEREVTVYLSQCSEAAVLGSITIHSEHKVSDVIQMLKSQLNVSFNMQLNRGTSGEKLKVPLHKKQYTRPALPFFPTEANHLVVDEVD